MIPGNTTLEACITTDDVTVYHASDPIAPAVFHRPQFSGSSLLSDGTGRFSVLPAEVIKNTLPVMLYDSRLRRTSASSSLSSSVMEGTRLGLWMGWARGGEKISTSG
jgi:hypothetical protein